jgi:hypothetical protein
MFLNKKFININLKTLFLICFLAFYGCAELNSALSNYNANIGGQCAMYDVSYYLYNPVTDKYLENKYFNKSEKGTDIDTKEYSWVQRTGNNYLYRKQFTTYFITSPYSGGKYRFIVECSRWHK